MVNGDNNNIELYGGRIIMEETGIIRDEKGRFVEGTTGNPEGRPPDTEVDIIRKKATKELIAEYKEALGESLPIIKPILIAKALEGDMTAIKEIHDRVMDKSKQSTDMYIIEVPKPILNVIPADNSNTENTETEEKN